ncbi:MAG: alpha/beta hydrolase [Actinomycetota bacterium]|nr:alpha/beta fold hydrolase [Acidimicrobiia bacterium]MDQ3468164.1 alpha/beta hydrolase [Actinomycetota bacterium]
MAWRRISTAGVVALTALAPACGTDSGVATERADAIDAPSADTGPDETSAPATVPEDPPATTDTDDTATPEPPQTAEPPRTTEPSATDATDPPDPSDDPFGWQERSPGVETGLLEVPVDYDDPGGATFELFMARRLADDQENKIGSLLVNPGGPGFGGSDFALFADQIYGQELLERFDIVGWDPRGTGESEPAVDCIDDYDVFFATPDITPDDDAERLQIVDLAREFAESCERANAEIIEHVGTNSSARDMDSIRAALGEAEISYFGFSYGSVLGATWATLFPDTVRAAVLDGASDPNADPLEKSLQQVRGFEGTLATYLAQCSADTSCAFHNGGDAEGAFDALMQSLDDAPIPSEPDRPDVNRVVALQGVIQAMYDDSFWPRLSEALAAAQDGDGLGLLQLYDAYYQRMFDGTWGNELEAFQTISCMDEEARATVEQEDADAPLFQEAGPRIAPNTTGAYFCTFFPPTTDPRIEITGAGAGPIVVIGTTGDPATPLESTRAMAATLEDGRLVVVTADQHTGYRVNGCVDDIVHSYLVDLEIPPEETEC